MDLENALVRYIGYDKSISFVNRDIAIEEGNFINAIVGPRRAGKTSLMLIYMSKLKVPESNKIFINCEDIDFIGITAADLSNLETAMYRVFKPVETERIYLFIDEVQTFPEWARWIRTLFDQHKYRILVTGSTSELSTERLQSTLRGRTINTLVLPFSFGEYLNVMGITYKDYMTPAEKSKIISAFTTFMTFGGYPEVTKIENLEAKRRLLSELYATVIQRDMIEKYRIRKVAVFKSFMNSLFGSACRDISIPKITNWFGSQNIKVSNQTIFNYVNYGVSSFLFFLVYPYSRKTRERNTKPKLYVSDSGILGLFESFEGKILENTIFIELKRRMKEVYYYKTATEDVDFVIVERKKVKELIQVSYKLNDPATYDREMISLLRAGEKLHCNNLTIITFEDERIIKHKNGIVNIIPAWKWSLSSSHAPSDKS